MRRETVSDVAPRGALVGAHLRGERAPARPCLRVARCYQFVHPSTAIYRVPQANRNANVALVKLAVIWINSALTQNPLHFHWQW